MQEEWRKKRAGAGNLGVERRGDVARGDWRGVMCNCVRSATRNTMRCRASPETELPVFRFFLASLARSHYLAVTEGKGCLPERKTGEGGAFLVGILVIL